MARDQLFLDFHTLGQSQQVLDINAAFSHFDGFQIH